MPPKTRRRSQRLPFLPVFFPRLQRACQIVDDYYRIAMWARSVYRRYTREDALVQTNGFFSLNLSADSVQRIVDLLDLGADSIVAWVGCGDGREVLSVAKEFPEVQFHAFEVNGEALRVARRVAMSEGVSNVAFHHQDFLELPRGTLFSHVYSTALAGLPLYTRLAEAYTERLCVLHEMCPRVWRKSATVAPVRLAVSGEQRRLVCVTPSQNNDARSTEGLPEDVTG